VKENAVGKRTIGGFAILAMLALGNGPLHAQDEAALRADLTSVIALLGLPCGQVVGVTRKGENDNLAVCRDGNRYRVYVNAEGRVVAKKQ
jgi:hypothetical protein